MPFSVKFFILLRTIDIFFFLVDANREYRGCRQVNQSTPLQQTSGARFFAHLMFYFTVPSFEDVYPVAHADIYSFF